MSLKFACAAFRVSFRLIQKRRKMDKKHDGLGRKIYLELSPPTEEDARGDRERLLDGLREQGYEAVVPLKTLRTLYPFCREAEWKFTAVLGWQGEKWEVLRLEKGDTSQCQYGVAVDLGSTTIMMKVIDLDTGKEAASQSIFNPQIPYGEEILSRIFYTKDQPEHLRELQELTAGGLNRLLELCEEECGVPRDEYLCMTVAGNTTMTHLLLGLFPWPVFETPFAPAAKEGGFIKGKELGIEMPGYVYIFPSAANYLGGDIISGLLEAGFYKGEELSVFIDIGTNGELVAGNAEFLLAGAGAAGPALEGGISRYGMRAEKGAVDCVSISRGTLKIHTIGGGKPRGICGSGIVKLLAEMFLEGWVDPAGNFNIDKFDRIIKVPNHLAPEKEEPAVCYAWADESDQGEDLVFTQTDVQEFIRTKAAAHTMVEYLLEEFGLEAGQIGRFYLAGGFGTHLELEAAVTIGIYPDLPREKFCVLGNASLKGAAELLLNREMLKDIEKIMENITYLQFGNAGDFLEKMHKAQFLPYTDLNQYPSVKEKLNGRRRGKPAAEGAVPELPNRP